MGKMFNDKWMLDKGFLDKKGLTAADIINNTASGNLITVDAADTIESAVALMNKMNISQIPVTKDKRIVGALNESVLFSKIVESPDVKNSEVETLMSSAFPFVDITSPIDSLSSMLSDSTPAVLVRDFKLDKTYIITRYDIVNALSK